MLSCCALVQRLLEMYVCVSCTSSPGYEESPAGDSLATEAVAHSTEATFDSLLIVQCHHQDLTGGEKAMSLPLTM